MLAAVVGKLLCGEYTALPHRYGPEELHVKFAQENHSVVRFGKRECSRAIQGCP
jgi:hypothetical protein